jgi:hypothetical protein
MSTEPKDGRSAYFNKLNKNIGAEVIPLLLIRHKNVKFIRVAT